MCRGAINELKIIDIKDVANPVDVMSYALTHPIGLSKDGNILLICDGKDGLKIYNAANVNSLQLIKHLNDAIDYDVIAQNGIAIVVASNGIYQYDYTDLANIHLISKL
jgi:exopolysaccharide biosynthesis protein